MSCWLTDAGFNARGGICHRSDHRPRLLGLFWWSGGECGACGTIEDLVQEVKPVPNGLLLEVAYDVCKPIGGIFQVIRSKAEAMLRVCS